MNIYQTIRNQISPPQKKLPSIVNGIKNNNRKFDFVLSNRVHK